MENVELIVSLLATIGVVAAISQRIKIALPLLLVVVGMIISLIPQIPDIVLDPNLVFFFLLPPLLYSDAFSTPWKRMKEVGEIIGLQAIGLVLLTVAAVAWAIHFVDPAMPWAAAFTFGAIVSPTDAVAAAAIAKNVKIPQKSMDIIKGESLVNDASGLVAYQFAVAAMVTGSFSWADAGERFLYVSTGGILLGLVIGWLTVRLRSALEQKEIEIVISLITPFIVYLAAEHFHVSGVLAVVAAGLYLGWCSPRMQSAHTRLHIGPVWETLEYILNGFAFLLMGLQLQPILKTLKVYPKDMLLIWVLTAAFAPIVIRFVWTFASAPIYYWIKKEPLPPWRSLVIVSWSGMRGVVSLAAALAIPLTCKNGFEFPFRDLIIFLTVTVIASTLLLQGLMLPYLIKLFGLHHELPKETTQAERQARLFIAREAVRTIDQYVRVHDINMEHPAVRRMLNHYLELEMKYLLEMDSQDLTRGETLRGLLTACLKAQRDALIQLRATHQIPEELFVSLEREMDHEEVHLRHLYKM